MRCTGRILLASAACLGAIAVQTTGVVAAVGGAPPKIENCSARLAGSDARPPRSADGLSPGVAHRVRGPNICRGDTNCDDQVDFADINPFVLYLSNSSSWQATYPTCPPQNGDINGDGTYGQGSFGDINPFVALLSSQPLPITCRALLVDNPAQLALGSLITLNVTPPGGPAFDANTTVRYVDATLAFAIDWAAPDVHVVSVSQAVLVVGTGTTDADVSLFLNPPSSLHGTLTANFGDSTLAASVDFALAPRVPCFHKIAYSVGGQPSLGDPLDPNGLRVAFAHGGAVPPEIDVLLSTFHHHAVAIEVMHNEYTQSLSTVDVQVLTYNSSGSVLADSFTLTLHPVNPAASPIMFVSDVEVPLVPFNVPVDRPALGYTQVIPFRTMDYRNGEFESSNVSSMAPGEWNLQWLM